MGRALAGTGLRPTGVAPTGESPAAKRDPLGGAFASHPTLAFLNRLARNAALGAAFCSYRAIFYRSWDLLPIMLAMGALAGSLYTILESAVRSGPHRHYLPWVLSAYLVIFGGVGVLAVLKHDEESAEVLTNPWFVGFVLVAGALGAYAAARTFEDD